MQEVVQLRFEVKAVVKNRIRVCHGLHISSARAERMRIDSRAAQQFDLCSRTRGNLPQRVGNVTGRCDPRLLARIAPLRHGVLDGTVATQQGQNTNKRTANK